MSPPNGLLQTGAEDALLASRRLAGDLGRRLGALGLCLATAESCTGGLIAALVTEIPGCSGWYLGGAVSYAESAKIALLGVAREDLRRHGAVSREVALAMAAGALARLGADLAVSATGFAGPGGGTLAEPVGSVWLGLARRGVPPDARRHRFTGGREAVRAQAAAAALGWVLEVVGGEGEG